LWLTFSVNASMPFCEPADLTGMISVHQKGQMLSRDMHARVHGTTLKLFRTENDDVPENTFKLDSNAVIEDVDSNPCSACACFCPTPQHQFTLHVKTEHVILSASSNSERQKWIQTLVKNGCLNQTAMTEFAAFSMPNPAQENPALRDSLSQQPQSKNVANPILRKADSGDKPKKAQRRGSVGSGERRMSTTAGTRHASMQRRGSNGLPIISKPANANRRGSSTDLVGAFQLQQIAAEQALADEKSASSRGGDTLHAFSPFTVGSGGNMSLDAMLGQVQQQRIAKEGGSNAAAAGVTTISEGEEEEEDGPGEGAAAGMLPFLKLSKAEVDAVLAELVMAELKGETVSKSPRHSARKLIHAGSEAGMRALLADPLNEATAKKVLGEGATLGPIWKPDTEDGGEEPEIEPSIKFEMFGDEKQKMSMTLGECAS
jgi:hypothetical protein